MSMRMRMGMRMGMCMCMGMGMGMGMGVGVGMGMGMLWLCYVRHAVYGMCMQCYAHGSPAQPRRHPPGQRVRTPRLGREGREGVEAVGQPHLLRGEG